MHLKGAQRILIEGGEKDDGWTLLFGQMIQHFEAIHLGHLHVEKDEIGMKFGDGLQRVCAVLALGHHLKLLIRLEAGNNAASRQWFVVNYQNSIHDHSPSSESPRPTAPRSQRTYVREFELSPYTIQQQKSQS